MSHLLSVMIYEAWIFNETKRADDSLNWRDEYDIYIEYILMSL